MNYPNETLPLREQARMRNQWLTKRFDTILPTLMARENIDLWLVICREYNEDPVIMSLLPAPAMTARRRTILAFKRQADGSVERYSLDRYGYGDFYKPAWNPSHEPDQYAALAKLVEKLNPKTIGINFSSIFAFGDGLSHTEYFSLVGALPPERMANVFSAERLVVGWLETRLPEELEIYPSLCAAGHDIIRRAFSRHVIQPGKTTTDDVVWWMRQAMHDFGVQAWFQPSIEIQAAGQSYAAMENRQLILEGDFLHCDIGFHYMGLATDQQQHAYVLKQGEKEAPAGLVHALSHGNRVQDIHLAQMEVGKTGNQVLAATRNGAIEGGLKPQIYSHPLGYHGHAAGATIGLWDMQDGVPGNGDYPVNDNTVWSIELNAKTAVPEWDGQEVRIALEEDAVLSDGVCRWLDGRQTEIHLI
ncbi:MAG: Xaa-Pro aminopeptidase [Candidatus Promineifilaceae bacterium]|jgi:Xaa-Pro aminopeptidase